MKKVYIAPSVEVNDISAELMICASELGVKSTPIDGTEVGFQKAAKDRGDYEPEDNTSFGDLW